MNEKIGGKLRSIDEKDIKSMSPLDEEKAKELTDITLIGGREKLKRNIFRTFAETMMIANQGNLSNRDFQSALKVLLNDTKIFKISEEIKEILLKTNNKIFERPLPFDFLFINAYLEEGDAAASGFWISNHFQTKTTRLLRGNFIRLFIYDYNLERWESVTIPLFGDLKNFVEGLRNESAPRLNVSDDEVGYEPKRYLGLLKKIRLFVINFLDFLNHPDVEIRVVEWPNNENRIKKGKLPIPDEAKITIKGKLYKYLYEELPQQTTHRLFSHSFWVRGHYMHFWNKKVWKGIYSLDDEELKEKGYQQDDEGIRSKWVLPYIKGQGILKTKPYELK